MKSEKTLDTQIRNESAVLHEFQHLIVMRREAVRARYASDF